MANKRNKAISGGTTRVLNGPVEQVNRETFKSQNFFSAYVNDVQVQTSIWDMRFTLGEVESADNVNLKVKELGEIRFSPQLAKRLITIMSEQIKTYEEKMGEIPFPRD